MRLPVPAKVRRKIRDILDDTGEKNIAGITERLEGYDVVSFDIFDTLIKRDVYCPKEVFSVIEKAYGDKGFAQKRIAAESAARVKSDKEDVTLEEIYACFETDKDRDELIKREIGAELNLCTVNRDIMPVYEWCLKNNKKIILISDMYLDKSVIGQILEKNGFCGYSRLYLSSDLRMSKYTGSLYRLVKSEAGENAKIIHIGNSFMADKFSAERNGIDAVKIRTNVRRAKCRAGRMKTKKYDRRDLWCFINNRTGGEDFYSDFGFENFGPALLGFVRWILKKMQEQNRETAIFLGRDGYLIKQVYDMLGYDKIIPSKYMEISRRALRAPQIAHLGKLEEDFPLFALRKFLTIRSLIDAMGLEPQKYRDIVAEFGLDMDEQLNYTDVIASENINRFYDRIKTYAKENALKETESLMKYLSGFDFGKKVAIVDVGWLGTIQYSLEELFREKEIKADMIGYYMGVEMRARRLNRPDGTPGACGYIYDGVLHDLRQYDKTIYYQFPFYGIIETLFLQQIGSVKNYTVTENGIIINRIPYECENDDSGREIIHKMQQGALRFCSEFGSSLLMKTVSSDSLTMAQFLMRAATDPSREEMDHFADVNFYDCGSVRKLIEKKTFIHCMLHISDFADGYINSEWRVAYLKNVMKIKLPYFFICRFVIPLATKILFIK